MSLKLYALATGLTALLLAGGAAAQSREDETPKGKAHERKKTERERPRERMSPEEREKLRQDVQDANKDLPRRKKE